MVIVNEIIYITYVNISLSSLMLSLYKKIMFSIIPQGIKAYIEKFKCGMVT